MCTLRTMSGEGGEGGGGAVGDNSVASSEMLVTGLAPHIDAFPTCPIFVRVVGSPASTLFTLDTSLTETFVLTVILVFEGAH